MWEENQRCGDRWSAPPAKPRTVPCGGVRASLVFVVLQKLLDSSLDIRLLKTATMVLFLAILEHFTFLLPVEFKVDISGSCRDRVVWINKLYYGL